MRRVIIAYWASTELAFIDSARRRCEAAGVPFRLVKIAHHADWFTARRSVWRNLWHLLRLFSSVVRAGLGGTVCVFGTNACRALYPFGPLFGKLILVYNELPCTSSRSLLWWYDRLVFRSTKHRFVSTQARARFVEAAFGLKRPVGVLENVSVSSLRPASDVSRRTGAVFAGTVTRKRFSDGDIEKFRRLARGLGEKIVVYGPIASTVADEFADFLEYRGTVTHREMLDVMAGYRYGLLAYYTDEPNCDLCAPLKMFEYLACGCQVISINRNAGLVEIAKEYPALVSFADAVDGVLPAPSPEEYERQRAAFIRAALASNERFVDLLLS